MVLPHSHYVRARQNAAFHVQVELIETLSAADTPCTITVCARVVRVFRASKSIHSDDTVRFGVAVNRRDDEIPDGGTIWIDYENFSSARFMEVFLDGDPPDCQVALWQCQLIESPSRKPKMKG